MEWREAALSKVHNRDAFDCGEPTLNTYFAKFARQNHEAGAAKTFVATPPRDTTLVLGYYTLSPASLAYARTPKIVAKGLGRYEVPLFRLGRLAVGKTVQGKGLGGELLLSAGQRCRAVATEVGGVALLIDAKSERAAHWYRSYGALPLDDAPLTLLLPLSVFAA